MNTIIVSELDHVATIKLNRQDVRNAFNAEMIQELTTVFKTLKSRNDLKAITLTGEGKVFCAGADLNWMSSMVNYSFEDNIRDAQALYEMFEAQRQLDTPMLAIVQGAVYGGALGLIANCDYVIAEQNTSFCFSEVKLGISPAVISSFVLEKANTSVHHFMLSGAVFNEDKAKELNLVHEVSPKNQGHIFIQKHLHAYKDCGPNAVRKTKQLLRDLRALGGKSPAALTTNLIAELRTSAEGQEGLKSFLEKRSPNWKV